MEFQENSICTLHLCFSWDIAKWCQVYGKADSWFEKSHEEFEQLQASTGKCKKLKLGERLFKKYIPSAKTLCTEDLSNITFNYLCENLLNYLCPFWKHKSSYMTQFLRIFLAQTLLTFYKIFRLSTTQVKVHQVPHAIFQMESQFFFESFFSSMRGNSTVIFRLKIYMLLPKIAHQSAYFQTCHSLH